MNNSLNTIWNDLHLGYRVPIDNVGAEDAPFTLGASASEWKEGSINNAVYNTAVRNGDYINPSEQSRFNQGTLDFISLLKYINKDMLYGVDEDSRNTLPGSFTALRGYPTATISHELITTSEYSNVFVDHNGTSGTSGDFTVFNYNLRTVYKMPYPMVFTLDITVESILILEDIVFKVEAGFNSITHYKNSTEDVETEAGRERSARAREQHREFQAQESDREDREDTREFGRNEIARESMERRRERSRLDDPATGRDQSDYGSVDPDVENARERDREQRYHELDRERKERNNLRQNAYQEGNRESVERGREKNSGEHSRETRERAAERNKQFESKREKNEQIQENRRVESVREMAERANEQDSKRRSQETKREALVRNQGGIIQSTGYNSQYNNQVDSHTQYAQDRAQYQNTQPSYNNNTNPSSGYYYYNGYNQGHAYNPGYNYNNVNYGGNAYQGAYGNTGGSYQVYGSYSR